MAGISGYKTAIVEIEAFGTLLDARYDKNAVSLLIPSGPKLVPSSLLVPMMRGTCTNHPS